MTGLTETELAHWSKQAGASVLSVMRRLLGLPVRGATGERIDEVLRKRGIIVDLRRVQTSMTRIPMCMKDPIGSGISQGGERIMGLRVPPAMCRLARDHDGPCKGDELA
jgi:hypothetical protein